MRLSAKIPTQNPKWSKATPSGAKIFFGLLKAEGLTDEEGSEDKVGDVVGTAVGKRDGFEDTVGIVDSVGLIDGSEDKVGDVDGTVVEAIDGSEDTIADPHRKK